MFLTCSDRKWKTFAFVSSGQKTEGFMTLAPEHQALEPNALRRRVERLVLGCQVAGSRLDPALDRASLYEDALHRAIQAAIDKLNVHGARVDIESLAQILARNPSPACDPWLGGGNFLATLRALPVHPRESGEDPEYDRNFEKFVASLRSLERRKAGQVELVAADAIPPEAIEWLWDGWLARGKLHLLAGAVGEGKTTLALSMAATLSAAARFPDGAQAKAGDILFWSGEDDPADSLVPRFLACGGDPSRLVFAKGVRDRGGKVMPFTPARDLPALARAMDSMRDLALLVVDPIVSAIAGDTDKNATVRRSLSALVDLATARNIAVLGIGHFGKTRRHHDPLSRILGSHAFTAMARLVMVTAKNAQGTSLLLRAKSNIGPNQNGFAFSLDRAEVSRGVVGQKIVWGEAVEGTAKDLLREAEDVPSPRLLAAQEWLAAQIGDGASVSDLMQAAPAAGHAWITVLRAKRALGLKVENHGRGGSIWTLMPDSVGRKTHDQ